MYRPPPHLTHTHPQGGLLALCTNIMMCDKTSRGSQMSRASTSRSERSRNLKVMGSNLDLAVFKPWSSQTNDFKIYTGRSLARCSALLGYKRTGWLSVRIIQLNGIVQQWKHSFIPQRTTSECQRCQHCHSSATCAIP